MEEVKSSSRDVPPMPPLNAAISGSGGGGTRTIQRSSPSLDTVGNTLLSSLIQECATSLACPEILRVERSSDRPSYSSGCFHMLRLETQTRVHSCCSNERNVVAIIVLRAVHHTEGWVVISLTAPVFRSSLTSRWTSQRRGRRLLGVGGDSPSYTTQSYRAMPE